MSDRPDFADIRRTLEEFRHETGIDGLPCPRPTCSGTIEPRGEGLRCSIHGAATTAPGRATGSR